MITEKTPLNATALYFAEATDHPLLTSADEQRLGRLLHAGQAAAQQLDGSTVDRIVLEMVVKRGRAARSELIRSNQRLVARIARRYQGHGLDFPDLISEGNIGLMTAAERFNPELGYKFSTYATYWIRQAMIRAIADKSRTIRLPAGISERVYRFHRTYEELSQRYGRQPAVDEFASALSITQEKASEMLIHLRTVNPLSIEAPVGDDEESTLGDLIPDTSEDPEGPVDERLRREALYRILADLPPREARIIELRFGLGTSESCTLEEIARQYGVTRERIRQLESGALTKLRQHANSHILRYLL